MALDAATSSEFLNVLNSLGCPYTQDVDESYVSELLFSSGEHRIRLLLWIFGEVHESVERMLNSQDVITRQDTGLRVDKRVQVLTSLAASFGICRAADLDLIRGNATHSKQLCFWRKLLSIVRFSKMPFLGDMHTADKHIMDEILTPDRNIVLHSASEKLDVLPHNLRKEMSMMLPNQKRALAGFSSLQEELGTLSDNLEIYEKKLSEVEGSVLYTSKDDEIALKNVDCTLSLTLNDLDQMMTTFEQVFTNSYLPYCNKQAEEFGDLGPVIQIVNKQLSSIVNTLDNLTKIKECSLLISRCTDGMPIIKEKLSRLTSVFDAFLSDSVNCLEQLSQTMDAVNGAAARSTEVEFSGRAVFTTDIDETITNVSTVK